MSLLSLFKKSKPAEILQPSKPKVLIAEDEVYLRDFYKELLQGEGFEVMTAVNGKETIALAVQNKPNVIILDVMMPIMDGLVVLEELKKHEDTKKIPVIVLTNAGNIENMETAKYHKAFKFLIKSNIIPDEIIRSTKDALEVTAARNI